MGRSQLSHASHSVGNRFGGRTNASANASVEQILAADALKQLPFLPIQVPIKQGEK